MVARVVVATVLALAPAARAEPAELAEARAAIARVQYHDARTLLLAALRSGGNTPSAVAEIYRLSASTATVLGDLEVARQYYRRWLALDPLATLPDTVAPKLLEPFREAEADMAGRGRLAVRARVIARAAQPRAVEVVIVSDPLRMAVAAALDGAAPVPVDAEGRVELSALATLPQQVAVLDEFGNHLLDVPIEEIAAPSPRIDTPPPAPSVPWWRRPMTWGAAAVALAGTGVGFGVAASRANRDLDAITAAPQLHYFDEVDAVRDRRERDALIANIALGAAGATAVVAAILYITAPDAPRVVASPGGVALAGSW